MRFAVNQVDLDSLQWPTRNWIAMSGLDYMSELNNTFLEHQEVIVAD